MKENRVFIKRVGLPIRVAAATLALQMLVFAACNKSGGTVPCKTLGSACNITSPNCDPPASYDGTITAAGSRSVVTGVGEGESGMDNINYGAQCTATCTITKDCAGKSPQGTVFGEKNVTPAGNACKG